MYQIAGVRLWNGLNKSIKQSVNVLQFKKRYKKFIWEMCTEVGNVSENSTLL